MWPRIEGAAAVRHARGQERLSTRRGWVWAFLVAMFLLFIGATRLGTGYLNLLWFQSVGYIAVFWRLVGAQVAVGVAGGLLFALVLFVNLLPTRRGFAQVNADALPPGVGAWLAPRRLAAVMAVVCVVVGLLAGLGLSSQWLVVLSDLYRVPFGIRDPEFGLDVGFFVFQLPFLRLVYETVGGVLVLSFLVCLGLYLATGLVTYWNGRLQVERHARAHLGILAGVWLLVKSSGYVLAAYGLDFSTRGVVFGASYADVHATLPALRLMTVAAAACAVVAFLNVARSAERHLGYALAGLIACSLVIGAGYPALVERLVVKPTELQREAPYIRDNIAMTRAAFNLNKIHAQSFVPKQDLTAKNLNQSVDTVRNVRLWSSQVAQEDFRQQQGLRTYYTFDPVTVDRYTVDSYYRQVLLSAREIDYASLPEQTWVNVHLKYTHGYGVVITPASVIGQAGLPIYWLSNMPPTSPVGFHLTQPQVYYGVQTEPYAIVDTNTHEFDYPSGQGDIYKNYKGAGGISLASPLARLALSLHEDDFNVLLSGNVTPSSKVLIYRNVMQHVEKIAPFLEYEPNPYMVLYKGHLYWIVDAYTTSSTYPYSEPAPGSDINYIRNSVKVVVNAYNGQTEFYIVNPHDPIIRTYERIFPGLFQPLAAMPAGLRAHIRYPRGIFQIQMAVYAKYHMTDPTVFYNREDLWQSAQEVLGSQRSQVQPYYIILQLPGTHRAEFLLMQPFTPFGKDNMVAWVAVRNDGANYGQMVAYEFPKGALTFGPLQVDARINENSTIAQDLALWSQQGSSVSRGRLIPVPLSNSLLYVEPIYQTAQGAQLPELRRVIVDYGDQIGFEPTLDGALTTIFGSAPPLQGPDIVGAVRLPQVTGSSGAAPPPAVPATAPATTAPAVTTPSVTAPAAAPPATPATGSLQATARQANDLYQKATQALQAGDFATFGADLKKLGPLLGRLTEQGTAGAQSGGAGAAGPGPQGGSGGPTRAGTGTASTGGGTVSPRPGS